MGYRKSYAHSNRFPPDRINEMRHTPGVDIWQRSYYDHIVRNEKSFNLIRLYIQTNPLMWSHDPDNPKRSERVNDLDHVLIDDLRFDKEELEFVRNYLEYRERRRSGSQTRLYK